MELIRVLENEEFEDYVALLTRLLRYEFETPRDKPNPHIRYVNILNGETIHHADLTPNDIHPNEPEPPHLSDIIHCPKQSYFKKIMGVSHNMRTLSYFFDGKAMHMMLQYLFDRYLPGRFLMENRTNVDDKIVFTPDIIDKEKNTIIEFKTARSPVINDAPRPDHIEQLKAYMAFTRIYNGVVLYHLITKEQENLFTAHRVQITPLEALEIREHWLKEAASLQFAVKNNNKHLARNIADDYSKNWMCNGYCDYLQYCDEGKAAVERIIQKRVEAKELRLAARKTKL